MKRMIKWLTALAMAAALSAALTFGAAAVHVPVFQDVSTDSPWIEGITYAAQQGIAIGTGGGQFAPDEALTARQWAVMLCRAYGQDVQAAPDVPFDEGELALAYREGWMGVSMMASPDSAMCRAAVYRSVFEAEGVPVYPYEFYEGGAPLNTAENYIRVAYENGLCQRDVDPAELITRGEAAQILFLVQRDGLRCETPEIVATWRIHDADGVDLGPYLREFQKVPECILEEYIQEGWSFRVDTQAVDALGEELGMSCAGMTSYQKKTIYAKVPACVVHEFGHFFHQTLGFPDVVDELYEKEAGAASAVLGDYAATNSREYFAEFFEYWIDWQGQELRMEALEAAAPETYSYFLTLEAGIG